MRSRIKELLNEKGIKHKYMAEKLEITPQYFSHICNDRAVPHVLILRKLAREMNCYIDELYEWDDS